MDNYISPADPDQVYTRKSADCIRCNFLFCIYFATLSSNQEYMPDPQSHHQFFPSVLLSTIALTTDRITVSSSSVRTVFRFDTIATVFVSVVIV
jgi:hypothetical protein